MGRINHSEEYCKKRKEREIILKRRKGKEEKDQKPVRTEVYDFQAVSFEFWPIKTRIEVQKVQLFICLFKIQKQLGTGTIIIITCSRYIYVN